MELLFQLRREKLEIPLQWFTVGASETTAIHRNSEGRIQLRRKRVQEDVLWLEEQALSQFLSYCSSLNESFQGQSEAVPNADRAYMPADRRLAFRLDPITGEAAFVPLPASKGTGEVRLRTRRIQPKGAREPEWDQAPWQTRWLVCKGRLKADFHPNLQACEVVSPGFAQFKLGEPAVFLPQGDLQSGPMKKEALLCCARDQKGVLWFWYWTDHESKVDSASAEPGAGA